MNLPNLTFVLGGAASGKSAFAENLCLRCGLARVYIATSQIYDDEMRAKVDRHKAQRGDDWHTIEEPLLLADHLAGFDANHVILIDCATLWLSNVMLGEHDLAAQTQTLLTAIKAADAPVVIVSNEVGHGIVPDNALARQFRNAQGRLNQDIAAQAAVVVNVIAGLPQVLKGQLPQ